MSAGIPMKIPASEGERAAPTERAMDVTPEAAERSSGDTTAIVYDWRVGTSIWDMLKRSRSRVIASDKLGMSGMSIRKMLDGMWVKTIVLINPNFWAILTASKAEIPARIFAPKKMLPITPASTPKRKWNHNANILWTISPPAKASRANKAESLSTTWRDLCKPRMRFSLILLSVISTTGERPI